MRRLGGRMRQALLLAVSGTRLTAADSSRASVAILPQQGNRAVLTNHQSHKASHHRASAAVLRRSQLAVPDVQGERHNLLGMLEAESVVASPAEGQVRAVVASSTGQSSSPRLVDAWEENFVRAVSKQQALSQQFQQLQAGGVPAVQKAPAKPKARQDSQNNTAPQRKKDEEEGRVHMDLASAKTTARQDSQNNTAPQQKDEEWRVDVDLASAKTTARQDSQKSITRQHKKGDSGKGLLGPGVVAKRFLWNRTLAKDEEEWRVDLDLAFAAPTATQDSQNDIATQPKTDEEEWRVNMDQRFAWDVPKATQEVQKAQRAYAVEEVEATKLRDKVKALAKDFSKKYSAAKVAEKAMLDARTKRDELAKKQEQLSEDTEESFAAVHAATENATLAYDQVLRDLKQEQSEVRALREAHLSRSSEAREAKEALEKVLADLKQKRERSQAS